MSRYFLKKLTIEGFRGVNNEGDPLSLTFKPDCVNSLFAYNGGGKSSVFEAVQYALSGSIAKLSRLHADEDADEYYANRFHSTGLAAITLTLAADDTGTEVLIKVERAPDGTRTVSSPTHADPASLLTSLNEELVLLDYHAFQRFVADKPLDRGRAFAGLLGLERISQMQQALETLSNTRNIESDFGVAALTSQLTSVERERTTAATQIRTAYKAIFARDLPPTSKVDSCTDEVLAHLKSQPTIDRLITATVLDAVDFDILANAIAEAEGGADRTELLSLGPKIGTLQGLAETTAGADAASHQTVSDLVAKRDAALQATTGELFQALFKAVAPIVAGPDGDQICVCPVCGSTTSEPIKHIVERHLQPFTEAAKATSDIQTAWRDAAFIQRFSDLESHSLLGVRPADRTFATLNMRGTAGSCTAKDVSDAWVALQTLEAARSKLQQNAELRKAALEAKLPASMVALTTAIQHARTIRDSLRLHADAAKRCLSLVTKLRKRKEWQIFVTQAADSFSSLSNALVKDRTTRIQTTCEALFKDIAKVDDVVPVLARAVDGQDLGLRLGEFHELTDIAAPAVLSESFQNAFAISVFLSAMLSTKPAARFVLLDDITSSFDSGHQWWLMETIRTKVGRPGNPDGPQVIILSHDGLLEKYFDTLGNQPGWNHIKLVGSSPRGMVFAQAQAPDRLKAAIQDHLTNGRIEEAKPLVRQYLEFSLQQIIRKLDIPVPIDFAIRDNNRLVSDCLDAIREAVTVRVAANTLILSPTQKNDLLTVLTPGLIANWVNHYGTATAAALAPAVITGVITAIDNYTDCFKYECRCDGTPRRIMYKTLSRKACNAC